MQTAALPWRLDSRKGPEVLLVTSRRSGRWIIPKGWPMFGKSLSAAAEREAYEEAGVCGKIDAQPLGAFEQTKRNLFGTLKVEVLVHPLAVEKELADWPERRQRRRRWFGIRDATAVVQSEDLASIISALGEELQNRG